MNENVVCLSTVCTHYKFKKERTVALQLPPYHKHNTGEIRQAGTECSN